VWANGKARIADVALADREWAGTTDLTRAPTLVRERAEKAAAVVPAAPGPPPPPEDDPAGDTVPSGTLSLAAALAQEKTWKARLAELEYKRRAGELVDAQDMEACIVDDYSRCRTKLLGLASKAKASLPHLTHADIVAIDAIVREALEEIARERPDDADGAQPQQAAS